jgi:hypothetical protein
MKSKILFMSSAAILLAASPLLADVRDGLVAYWPLDTATGGTPMSTPDVVAGNNLTGPFKDSSSALVPGKFGNAVTFFGNTSDYINFVNAPGADSGLPVANNGSWTWALWVNGSSGQGNQTTYFCESSSLNSSGNPRFSMEGNGADKTRYFIRDINGTVLDQIVGTKPTLDGTWHHVAYTYNANTGQFLVYVDGQPDGTNTFTYAKNLASWDQVAIGALVRNNVAVPFSGSVDDVALWSRVLSQSEIQNVMNNSIATPIPASAPVVTVNPVSSVVLYEGDNYTLNASVSGSRPLSYQWIKNGTNVPGATLGALNLTSVTTNDSGSFRLVITNSSGSVTSTVAQVTVNAFGTPNLTNGIIAYYPCDAIVGTATPELVSAFDMPLFGGMNSTNIVAGKWGNALSFDRLIPQYGKKVFAAGDAMPGARRTNFTCSFWMKSPPVQGGGFFFDEASSKDVNTFLGFGNSGGVNSRLYIRNSSGGVLSDNSISTPIWDDAWHNVIYSQRALGDGTLKAQIYFDGVLQSANPQPNTTLKPDTLAFCINGRSSLGGPPSGGTIDEVVYWSRALSTNEIALVQTGYITNPPVLLPPLAVNSFKADLPAVAKGDSTVLRWDVPVNTTQVLIDKLGDVTAQTVSGVGSTNLTLNSATTYVLTAIRDTAPLGHEVVSVTNTIGVVDGIAANWHLLDNFDYYGPGSLASFGTWVDMGGNSVAVVTPTSCNRMVKTTTDNAGAYLSLKNLTVNSNQSCTLFFRMIPQGNPASALMQVVGISDKPANFYYQIADNVGPLVRPTVNDPSQNPGDWLLAARNIPYSPLTFDTNVLQPGAVYSVWIDVTNVFIGDRIYPDNYDMFSVYLQKEGDAARTIVFSNFISDRDLLASDPLTGGLPTDPLTRVYLGGNSTTDSALFDDFYLSKTGYNATIPRPVGYAGPGVSLQIHWNGSQLVVQWPEGKLQEAGSVAGPWTDVSGATAPSYQVTPSTQKFYRAVCN